MKKVIDAARESCVCGARGESPHSHPHVSGCRLGKALASYDALKEESTTDDQATEHEKATGHKTTVVPARGSMFFCYGPESCEYGGKAIEPQRSDL